MRPGFAGKKIADRNGIALIEGKEAVLQKPLETQDMKIPLFKI